MELDNGQVRFICGDKTDLFINRTPVGNISETHLKAAIKNINNYFIFIGTVEQFGHSFDILKRRLGWFETRVKRLNVATDNYQGIEINETVKKEIMKRNQYDRILFEHVSDSIRNGKHV